MASSAPPAFSLELTAPRSHSVLIKRLSFVSFAVLLVSMGLASLQMTTPALIAVSVMMSVTCLLSAAHLVGLGAALRFAAIALGIGFFAEFTGSQYGWFFGKYVFTDALGPRLAGVPLVIPLMWFNLSYVCYVLANLILERAPLEAAPSLASNVRLSAFSAFLVTAYDLAADPYMVFVVKAWVMEKTDGWWFGETLQGFVGWFVISFAIIFVFRLTQRRARSSTSPSFQRADALMPVLIYACSMGFQMLFGSPVETRTISFFAMGIPLYVAFATVKHWSWRTHSEEGHT